MKNYFVYPKSEETLVNGFEYSAFSVKNINIVSEHSHDFYEIYLLLHGKIEFTVRKDKFMPTDCSVIIISPDTLHKTALKMTDGIYERKVLWVTTKLMAEAQFERAIFNMPITLSSYDAECVKSIFSLFEAEQKHFESGEQPSGDYSAYLLSALLAAVFREKKSMHVSPFIEQITSYIKANPEKPLSLKELSDRFFLSKYYLSHRFKEETGISLNDYSKQFRLSRAKTLLNRGFSLEDAAEQCGYTDYSCFYKAFKKQFNMSPSAYIKHSDKQ